MGACAHIPSPSERLRNAENLAESRGWTSQFISAPPFILRAFSPRKRESVETLSVYIEGDGMAWLNREQPALDPTPINPIALRLALAQPQGDAAYLSRPCQFLSELGGSQGCTSRYWTKERYSPRVIDAMNEAIAAIKRQSGAKRLILIGYSGGGGVAALVAARRHDVERLITVAGNLDVRFWASYQKVDPLEGSENPVDIAHLLGGITQIHYVGSIDPIIPVWLAENFVAVVPGLPRPRIVIVPNFDHVCCWVQQWGSLFNSALSKN